MTGTSFLKILTIAIALGLSGCSGIFEYDGRSTLGGPTPPPGPPVVFSAYLDIVGFPADAPRLGCVGPVYVVGRDLSGAEAPLVTEDTAVVLSTAQPDVGFYTDGECQTSGSPTAAAGRSRASFYLKSATAQNVRVRAAVGNRLTESGSIEIYLGDPTRAIVRGVGLISRGECISAEVQLLDDRNKPATTTNDLVVSLAFSSGLVGAADAACATAATEVTVQAGQDSAVFYVKQASVGPPPASATVTAVLGASPPALGFAIDPSRRVTYDRGDSTAGGQHSYCSLINGRAHCWGDGSYRRLGDGTTADSPTPREVSVLQNGVTAVTLGSQGGCALKEGGAFCWGDDGEGALGDGATTGGGAPRGVVDLASGVTQLSRGPNHSCAVVDGGVKCWGYGANGSMGNGTNVTSNPAPVDVLGLGRDSGVLGISVSGAYGHSYAIAADRRALSWGNNGYGELGIGNNDAKNFPQVIALPVEGSRVTSLAGSSQALAATGTSLGHGHACALSQGSPLCWGWNPRGALGNGTTTSAYTPVRPGAMPPGVYNLIVGGQYGMSLTLLGGAVLAWGDGQDSTLLRQIDATLVYPSLSELDFGRAEVLRVFPSARSVCYLKGSGLHCAGYGFAGQLGNGSTVTTNVPVPVTGIDGVLGKVSAAGSGTCVAWNGRLYCAGENVYRQIGGPDGPVRVLRLIAAPEFPNGVSQAAYGEEHTCAVSSGSVYCLGHNVAGELGVLPSVVPSASAPRKVSLPYGVSGVVAAAVGTTHSCAVASGRLFCWGSNGSGELGLGTRDGLVHEMPAAVTFMAPPDTSAPMMEVTAVGASGNRTCALVNGALACWGGGLSSPAYVNGLFSGVSHFAVGRSHACAIRSGGVVCFGENQNGQLGNNSDQPSAVPVEVQYAGQPLRGATAVAVGDSHSCAVAQGRVFCWGWNGSGQLGDSTGTLNQRTALEIRGTVGAVDVAAGRSHTCALSNGRLLCWGANDTGQLANAGKLSLRRASNIQLPQ